MTSKTPQADASAPDNDVTRVLMALHPKVVIDGSTASGWFEPQPEHRGNPGWLHGGLAATVLDHVCARAASASLGGPVVTAKLDLRYRQPVAIGSGPYEVVAMASEPRRSTVRVQGTIRGADGKGLVQAKALFVTRPSSLDPG